MKELILIAVGSAIVNNVVLTRLFYMYYYAQPIITIKMYD